MGSPAGFHLEERALDQLPERQGHRYPGSQPGSGQDHDLSHEESQNIAARRAESHADADLLRPPRHAERGDAIEADGSQQGRQKAECERQPSHESRVSTSP